MNKHKRIRLTKAISHLETGACIIEEVMEEEESSYENLPDSLKFSENGEKMQDNVDKLSEAHDEIINVIENVSEII
jgi:hypothetical protein